MTTDHVGTLQERLDKYKAEFESGGPPHNTPREVIETFHRGTDELRRSGLKDRALRVAERAPFFELKNQDDVAVSLSALLTRGPVVISFFRGHW